MPTDGPRNADPAGVRRPGGGVGAPFLDVAREWDARYAKERYTYGTEPNAFLTAVANHLPIGRVLSLGEGEGRNAAFLAAHGWSVHGVDASAVGLEKAHRLAAELGVTFTTEVADLGEYVIDRGAWEGIVSIFCHLPPAARRRLHEQVVQGLRPGGVLVLEAYTPHQLHYGTGGPPIRDLLVSLDDLRAELGELEFVIAREVERDVVEGRLHVGRSAVVQLVGRKFAEAPSI